MGEWSPLNIGSPSEADAGIGTLLGWNDLPLVPSLQATSYFIHSVIMSGDMEILGVATTSYALSLTSVLRKPEHVRDSGFTGAWSWAMAAYTAQSRRHPWNSATWQHCYD